MEERKYPDEGKLDGKKYPLTVLRLFQEYELDPKYEGSGPLPILNRCSMILDAYVAGLEAATQKYLQFDDKDMLKLRTWQAEQDAKVAAMQKNRKPYYGAAGGEYVYTYCPTTIGVVVKVRNDVTNEEIDLSDYDNW